MDDKEMDENSSSGLDSGRTSLQNVPDKDIHRHLASTDSQSSSTTTSTHLSSLISTSETCTPKPPLIERLYPKCNQGK